MKNAANINARYKKSLKTQNTPSSGLLQQTQTRLVSIFMSQKVKRIEKYSDRKG